MTESETLSPCPFCGMDSPDWCDRPSTDDGRDWNWIQCRRCESKTGEYRTKDEAVEVWNRRTPERPR